MAVAWTILVYCEGGNCVSDFVAYGVGDIAQRADALAVESMLFFRELLLVGTPCRHVMGWVLWCFARVALFHSGKVEGGRNMLLGGDGDGGGCADNLEAGVLNDWGLDRDVPRVDELVSKGVEVGGVVGCEKEVVGGGEEACIASLVGAADDEGRGLGRQWLPSKLSEDGVAVELPSVAGVRYALLSVDDEDVVAGLRVSSVSAARLV